MNDRHEQGKLIVIVAPSGSGKTTIARCLLREFPEIRLSTSATTRKPRRGEIAGRDYHFLSEEEFDSHVTNNNFLEWEEFYNGTRYGTLRSEVDKLMEYGYFPLLDIEVKGALNVKKMYGADCVSIFIQPPSLEELENRLISRGTETKESLALRLERASEEIKYAAKFDHVVINDDLDIAYSQVKVIVESFIADKT